MWQQLFLGFLGLCSGIVIASGVAGLLIGLSIIPRYAGITHTGDHVMLYEDAALLGIIFGNLFVLFRFSLPPAPSFWLSWVYSPASSLGAGFWLLRRLPTCFRSLPGASGFPRGFRPLLSALPPANASELLFIIST